MTIRLTEYQHAAIEGHLDKPIKVIDPATNQAYVLVTADHYQRAPQALEGHPPFDAQDLDSVSDIPPGILRAQQAFWRDLPELLNYKKNRGKWVCYHGDERIGIGEYHALIRECLRRGFPNDAYHLGVIAPRALPPWEPEEIDPGSQEMDVAQDQKGSTGATR